MKSKRSWEDKDILRHSLELQEAYNIKTWHSVMPKNCDMCHKPITNKFIDGRTSLGPWAIMCSMCHDRYGVGLGLGKGQEYLIKQ